MKHRQTNNGVIVGNGINGSLRKREVTQPQQHTEYYLFNSQGNLKAYSDDVMSFAYYGYNAANTRTYKLSLYNTNLWINGQQQPLNMQLQNAMFYPNTYLNFNGNGEYTKHYYNGTERIASRLGDNTTTIALNNNILEARKLQLEEQFREDIHKLIEETVPIDLPPFIDVNALQPTGTPNDIYYYHPNHLGSTSFVTDNNATITQGFLYAPFGEITTEYNINFGNNIIPKYSFNAKELDEETGMYYYEARYYKPPVFTSRDPMFEKYFWMTPYAYCANNPVKYVDPSGMDFDTIIKDNTITIKATYYTSKENEADLQKALDVWNNQSGQYSYVVGKGKDKQTYTINFELTTCCFETSEKAKYEFEQNVSVIKGINLYKGKTSTKSEEQGHASAMLIEINPNTVNDIIRTLAHEIGHTLGIGHYKGGLMESGGTSNTIVIEYIHEMFSRFITGPTTYSTWQSCPRSDDGRVEHESIWENWFNKKQSMSGIIR